MQNHYEILGVTSGSSTAEIKAAFRRLAKLYHPDKNPQGKEQFAKILLAYEVLVDSSRRKQYDLKLKHGSGNYSSKKTASKQKEWGFSDEELKRRQYYKEHYKKEYERYTKSESLPKKTYNEYKYILFAAPLAVGLLMFIVNSYEQSTAAEEEKKSHIAVAKEPKKDELKITADPFTPYFGKPVYDIEANRIFLIKNLSSKDLVIALFDEKNKFLRSTAVKSGLAIEISQLPAKELNIRSVFGKYWSSSKERKGLDVIGGFTEDEKFAVLNTRETNGYSVTIDEQMLSAMEEIGEKEFFRKN